MIFDRSLSELVSPDMQISEGQTQVILAAIALIGSGCRLLVFGCGNDSALWHRANKNGKTVFVEHNEQWVDVVKTKFEYLDIRRHTYETTVFSSLPIDEESLQAHEMPSFMTEEQWDIIIVDAPDGYRQKSPGRSLPIYWTSIVAAQSTQIFIDDYQRPLEEAYAKHFVEPRSQWNVVIPRNDRRGRDRDAKMLWSIGLLNELW